MRSISLKLVDYSICEKPIFIFYKAMIMCVIGNRRVSVALERRVVGPVYLVDFERLIGVGVGAAILKGFGVGFLRGLISVK